MAKTPVIFSKASSSSATGSMYSVPAGTYAIVNCSLSSTSNGSSARLLIDGMVVAQATGSADNYRTAAANGVVCPEGTTIQVTVGSSGMGIASGFVYDI